ncbi:serine protease [Acrocarpospora phusangensis]|uniref:Serine protease n=1 Tax=Acrocarpospora phusangensis TaxID=1070424 RepID=A0A919UQ17_9ACTN|nr:S8 family serine peptidase [Acrocarpospora phusangensis]GIH26357.1 serine protease [Acrocarpospora phusangensis]
MSEQRRAARFLALGMSAALLGTALAWLRPASAAKDPDPPREYLVFYVPGGRDAAARAVTASGGTVTGEEPRIGYLLARTADPVRVDASPAVAAVASDRKIGAATRAAWFDPGPPGAPRQAPAGESGTEARKIPASEPLARHQWDMRMIGATPAGSYSRERGSHKVLVGVIDTGIDGKHPDIAPNFNRKLSRNFVTDIPKDPNGATLDGPCEYKSCKDPADVDDDGHGTHVASTIGSPLNGVGIGGVAPGVSLVNLRAGHDSGFFFLKPTMDALMYAGDKGIDVVNMSFYVDPWMFNCASNPADTPAQQQEQRGIVEGMKRALGYARARGVTLVSAIGNSGLDLGKITEDTTSPDYPVGAERERKVDNSCLNVPTELDGVISVTSLGPSGRKAIYSDYGLEQADVAAPGGDLLDGDTRLKASAREILAAAPTKALRAQKQIDKRGRPLSPAVLKSCSRGRCAYYQYLEGTSMAAPHVTGVVALLVARFGKPGRGGLHLDPATAERLLYESAKPKACPKPRAYQYSVKNVQVCEGTVKRNGFFGHGVANAFRAVTLPKKA